MSCSSSCLFRADVGATSHWQQFDVLMVSIFSAGASLREALTSFFVFFALVVPSIFDSKTT